MEATEAIEKSVNSPSGQNVCYRGGYLPIPLRSIPVESLTVLPIHLREGQSYSLYSGKDVGFSAKDQQRLLDSDVEFVYVSVRDQAAYYMAVEEHLFEIISDRKTPLEKKAEILYSTSIELANQILLKPPTKMEIARTIKQVQSIVGLVIQGNDTFRRLSDIFDHDFYTVTHMVNVCLTLVSFANIVCVGQEKLLGQLGLGAMLHDIGMTSIPGELLNSTEKLSEAEFSLIKSHVATGRDYLCEAAELPADVIAVVMEHHERLDGSGYPLGLKGEQISFAGRIAGIVDTFEAMTSVRPYREYTCSVAEALEHLAEQAGTKYDAQLVKAFTKMINDAMSAAAIKPSEDQAGESVTVTADDGQSGGQSDWQNDDFGRSHARFFFRLKAILRVVQQENGKWVLGPTTERIIVHNISRSGLGLISSKRLGLNDNIYIGITEGDVEEPTVLRAVVMRCVTHMGGWYTIGARLHEELSAEFVETLKSRVFVRN